jgi:Adenylylsulfate kinase and related kinases
VSLIFLVVAVFVWIERTLPASDRIEALKLLKASEMDASSRSECLPNTRRDVVEFVLDWVTSPIQVQNVLWLYGIAGSGKSTISTTIAEYLRELGRLGAFLFFNRQVATLKDPSSVVRTLAYQLASFDGRIEEAVCKQIEGNPRISESPLRLQIERLLVEPLTSVAEVHTQGPIVIVLDALDECGDERSRESLLSHLVDGLQKLPPAFRIFITSRPESDIKASFDCKPNILARELDVKAETSKADVLTYIRHNMASLQQRNKYLLLSADWPGQSRIQSLAEHSAGLFIYAATAVKFLRDGQDPDERLSVLLSTERRAEAESSLDELYTVALRCAGRWEDKTFVSDFCAILGIIWLPTPY